MSDRMRAVLGDITKMRVDAIVNAANESLLGGGGIDYAIHKAAGPDLLSECMMLGGCDTGDAKATGAYRLPCKMIVHAVGPEYSFGRYCDDEELLRSCYKRSIEVASERGARTIAFPSISTGIFKYPAEEACEIAVDEVEKVLADHPEIERVDFVCIDEYKYGLYVKELERAA